MSSSKDRQNAVKKLRSFLYTQKIDVNSFRGKIDDTFSEVYLPNNVALSEHVYGGVRCDILSPEIYSSKRILLYVHGGAFVGGSRKSYRPFVSALANATSSRAVLPEFRLAPSYPYPFPLEDLQNVFQNVYSEEIFVNAFEGTENADDQNPEILIAADSSGASIALALMLKLKGQFRSAVKKIILFSPWLDISEDSEKFKSKKFSDEVFTIDSVRLCAENYAIPENRSSPYVSPLLADKSQYLGFPPVFIQMGEREMFLEDAQKFVNLLTSVGAKCDLDIWKGMMPLFVLADEYLSESHLAIEKIGKMITSQSRDDD